MGIERVIPNLRIVLASEIERYAVELLVQHMEEGKINAAPIWTDLKTLSKQIWLKEMVEPAGGVDILTGGFP